MGNIILLFLCLLSGLLLRALGRVPENAHLGINAIIINVSLPALTLLQIHGIVLQRSLLYPIAMPWIVFAVAGGVIWAVGRSVKLSAQTVGALILTAGLANTSFVGLPMIETFYGQHEMATGILIDQLGTYLVLSTLGVAVACWCSRGTASPKEIARRVATFPPLVALVCAMALMSVPYPTWATEVLNRLAGTLAPLALVSVGLQLRLGALRERLSTLSFGVGFKLLVAPLVVAVLYLGILGAHGETIRVTLFEAAMGPQIGAAIVAMQYKLDPQLVTLMVGIGSLMAFLTLPAWWYALSMV
jgi:predicted permease